MKRILVALAAVTLGVAVLGSGGAGASGGVLIEARGFPCGVFDADRILRVTTNSYFALYSSGKTHLRCEAQGSNSSGAIHKTNFASTGFTCNVPFSGITRDWSTRHSRGGMAQMDCYGSVDLAEARTAFAVSSAGQ